MNVQKILLSRLNANRMRVYLARTLMIALPMAALASIVFIGSDVNLSRVTAATESAVSELARTDAADVVVDLARVDVADIIVDLIRATSVNEVIADLTSDANEGAEAGLTDAITNVDVALVR